MTDISHFYDEDNNIVRYDQLEVQEQLDAKEFIKEDDIVIELGARWGGVSVIINSILKNKKNHVAVEPDKVVWDALEKNRDNHNCEFIIIKGAISNKPLKIDKSDKRWNGLATFTKGTSIHKSDVKSYDLPDLKYNVLVSDCEGFLETFYDENKDIFKGLRLILLEKDRPEECDYPYLYREFKKLGFTETRDSGDHKVFHNHHI
tara:strand:- start:64 stop:675 length:612 start_codon:yes stop_codon:yes gene_type:complete